MIINHDNIKQLWIIAGINGSGKTSFTNKYLRGKIAIINPDEIAIEKNISSIQAGKIAIRERKNLIESKISFSIETTLSGINEIELIKTCKKLNYKINIIYLYLDSLYLARLRINQRIENHGHNIEDKDILRRYPRSLENFKSILKYADRVIILDNSSNKLKLVCSIYLNKIKFISKNIPKKIFDIVNNNYD